MLDTITRRVQDAWSEVASFFDEADDLFLDDPLLAPVDPVLPASGFPSRDAGVISAA
jgi:hypothetical protein